MQNKFSTLEKILRRVHAKTNLQNKPYEYPEIKITVYEKRNLVAVKINESIVFARTFVTLEQPFPDRTEGKLKLNFNSSQLIEPLKELWIPNLEALEYGRVIERGLRGHIIDLSKLVVNPEQVWSLNIELHCFSVDGNIIDCGFYAALESLKRVKLPFENYNLQKYDVDWLNLNCFCKTLYVYKNKIVQNTNVYETDICNTGLTVVICNDRIVAMQKLKGAPIKVDLFKELIYAIFESNKFIKITNIDNIWENKDSDIYRINL